MCRFKNNIVTRCHKDRQSTKYREVFSGGNYNCSHSLPVGDCIRNSVYLRAEKELPQPLLSTSVSISQSIPLVSELHSSTYSDTLSMVTVCGLPSSSSRYPVYFSSGKSGVVGVPGFLSRSPQ